MLFLTLTQTLGNGKRRNGKHRSGKTRHNQHVWFFLITLITATLFTRCHCIRLPTRCKGWWTLPPMLVTLRDLIVDWRQFYMTSSIAWMFLRGLSIQARCDVVPVSVWTGTSLPRRPPHPSLWCCSSPSSSSTICQPEPSHCASLSTQHVRLSGVRLRWPDSLELATRWT